MQLRINDNALRILIYGEAEAAQALCDELLDLGHQPECLLYDDSNGDYRGVKTLPKAAITAVMPTDDLRIIAATQNPGHYRKAHGEIIGQSPDLANYVNRSILILAELLRDADLLNPPAVLAASEPHTWLGMNLGFVMGGVETWVGETYHDLCDAGVRVKVIEPLQNSEYIYVGPEFYGVAPEDVLKIGPYETFTDYVLQTIELICQDPPRIFIDNGSVRTLVGVHLAKKWLGLPTRVISVLHGDAGIFYTRITLFDESIDRLVVVSDTLLERATVRLPHRAGGMMVKLRLPKMHSESLDSKLPNDVLHIAYAARLEKGNKRSLWLMDVADGLAKRGVPFVLHVAGDGEPMETLTAFVKARGFEDRMRLYGRIDHSQMDAFYANKHAFVNFSISEGGPLTLFESISHGLAPVVTDAGTAKQLIQDGENGFIIDSPEQAVERLCVLAGDVKTLQAMQKAALQSLEDFRARQGNFIEAFL